MGISDLITLVNIALGGANASACPHGVPRGAEVDIALIIQAVNNALNGCPPKPSTTPPSSPNPLGTISQRGVVHTGIPQPRGSTIWRSRLGR